MKKEILLSFLVFSTVVISCKKDDNPGPTTASSYNNVTPGSSWQFRTINNRTAVTTNYSLLSTAIDTPINGKQYHIFTNSNGNTSEYYVIAGNDYFNYRALGAALGDTKIEALYLKDNAAVGATWAQTINLTAPGVPLPIPVTLTSSIAEKSMTRVVNSVSYSNVIHVKTIISSSFVPATGLSTDINNYYAPRVGVIETSTKININFSGITDTTDTKTILLSSDLK